MESNRCLVFFLFGLSMLPKIYSDVFPSLILVKKSTSKYMYYYHADKIKYAEGENNLVEFSTSSNNSSGYHIYNACPRENEPLPWTYSLEIKGEMTDLQPITLEHFVKGLFDKYEYNCEKKITPIALKYDGPFKDKFALEGFEQYDIGFVVYESDANYEERWKRYENAANEQLPKEYHLVKFLTVTMDTESGTIYSVHHQILGGKFLQPDLVFNPPPVNEKNVEEYGFDVDSLYKEENQQNILSSIFGQFNPEHSLIKVQLAPYQDFLLDIWKLSSFMDLNTVGMWKQVYPQWKKIEEFVRDVARKLGDLYVETGTAQILELSDLNLQLKQVFLGIDKKSAVTKYVWKRITIKPSFTQYTRAILIVMHNDPYTENQEQICNNEGEDFGWLVSNDDFKTGLTYVCPLHDNITRKLHEKLEVSASIFKLNNMQKLDDSD